MHDLQDAARPATYTGMYAMHKYWSKKPHNLVASYIERFSTRGDLVLDAFCGSGVTVSESVRRDRRAVGIDINPAAVVATRQALQHCDPQRLTAGFAALQHQVAASIDQLYATACPRCGNPQAVATHTIWADDAPREVWVACRACGTRKAIRPASAADSAAAWSPTLAPAWYPTTELVANARLNVRPGTRVADLFTPRGLVALSLLLQAIRQIADPAVRATLEFCFSAALPQASRLVFVIRRRGRLRAGQDGPAIAAAPASSAEVGSWVIGYWIPAEHFEIHAWRCFANRFRRVLRGKQQVNRAIPATACESGTLADLLQARQGYWTATGTATSLPLEDATVDYIFTDPPHGNRVPYLELSLLWNAWLQRPCDWEGEIVISEAKGRSKDSRDYRQRLARAFGEYWRVLKPGKYLSVAFNSRDDATWRALLDACLGAGFALAEVRPLAYSARSVVQDSRKNALKTDLVLTCQKRLPCQPVRLTPCSGQAELARLVGAAVARRADGAEPDEILSDLLIAAAASGRHFSIAQIRQTLERTCRFADGRWYAPVP